MYKMQIKRWSEWCVVSLSLSPLRKASGVFLHFSLRCFKLKQAGPIVKHSLQVSDSTWGLTSSTGMYGLQDSAGPREFLVHS